MPRVLRDPICVRFTVSQGLVYSSLFERCCPVLVCSADSVDARCMVQNPSPRPRKQRSVTRDRRKCVDRVCRYSRRNTYEESGYGYSAAYRQCRSHDCEVTCGAMWYRSWSAGETWRSLVFGSPVVYRRCCRRSRSRNCRRGRKVLRLTRPALCRGPPAGGFPGSKAIRGRPAGTAGTLLYSYGRQESAAMGCRLQVLAHCGQS